MTLNIFNPFFDSKNKTRCLFLDERTFNFIFSSTMASNPPVMTAELTAFLKENYVYDDAFKPFTTILGITTMPDLWIAQEHGYLKFEKLKDWMMIVPALRLSKCVDDLVKKRDSVRDGTAAAGAPTLFDPNTGKIAVEVTPPTAAVVAAAAATVTKPSDDDEPPAKKSKEVDVSTPSQAKSTYWINLRHPNNKVEAIVLDRDKTSADIKKIAGLPVFYRLASDKGLFLDDKKTLRLQHVRKGDTLSVIH